MISKRVLVADCETRLVGERITGACTVGPFLGRNKSSALRLGQTLSTDGPAPIGGFRRAFTLWDALAHAPRILLMAGPGARLSALGPFHTTFADWRARINNFLLKTNAWDFALCFCRVGNF
jgi:hypothetical protein